MSFTDIKNLENKVSRLTTLYNQSLEDIVQLLKIIEPEKCEHYPCTEEQAEECKIASYCLEHK